MLALYLSRKETREKGAIDAIKERGYMIATLEPNTLNYFLYKGTPRGYELNLLESFAKSLNIPLKVLACSTTSQALLFLQHQEVDIIASALPETRAGKNMVHFSHPLMESSLVLVQRNPALNPNDASLHVVKEIKGLRDDTLVVCQNLFFQPLYDKIMSKTGKNMVLKVIDETPENLYKMVADGMIHYALCPDYIARVLSRVYQNTDASLIVTRSYPFAWAVNHPSDSLLMMIDNWLDSIARTGYLHHLFREYFESPRVPELFTKQNFSLEANQISPWDNQIKQYSSLFWWDWRLVASLMYAESNFIPGLTSHKSAYGLMQMIPSTANIYGLDTNSSVSHQIMAGIKYLKWIDHQLPPEITDSIERASFILASYNQGIGRVSALRQKAAQFGKDPNKWHGNVEYFLEKQSISDPYAYADSTRLFPVDYNMDGYVDGIIQRYFHYQNLFPE